MGIKKISICVLGKTTVSPSKISALQPKSHVKNFGLSESGISGASSQNSARLTKQSCPKGYIIAGCVLGRHLSCALKKGDWGMG